MWFGIYLTKHESICGDYVWRLYDSPEIISNATGVPDLRACQSQFNLRTGKRKRTGQWRNLYSKLPLVCTLNRHCTSNSHRVSPKITIKRRGIHRAHRFKGLKWIQSGQLEIRGPSLTSKARSQNMDRLEVNIHTSTIRIWRNTL